MNADRAIDNKQKAIIHIALQDLGISDNDYRILLLDMFPAAFHEDDVQPSCLRLSHAQADQLIDEFKRRGFVVKSTKPQRPQYYGRKRARGYNLVDLPSPQIIAKIKAMAADIRWNVRDGYERWVMARYHVSRPRTMHEAMMIVEGLKAMRARQNIRRIEAAEAPAREPF
jgi:hypothetical protein